MEVDQHEAMDYRQRRRTLTVMDLVQNSNVDASVKDIGRAVLLLDHEIANALAGIAQMVDMKYKDLVPDLCVSNTLLDKVRLANANLKSMGESVLQNVDSMQKGISEDDRTVIARAKVLNECMDKISVLEELENDLSVLWYSEKNERPLQYAKLVTGVEEKLCNLLKKEADMDKIFAERICPALRQETVVLREGICHLLSLHWDKVFTFTEQSSEFLMKIFAEGKDHLEERLEAMRIVRTLDGKLAKLSKTLLNNICLPMIRRPNVELLHNRAVGLARPVSEYRVKVPVLQGNSKQQCEVEHTFELLNAFFTNLHEDLGAVKVNNAFFVGMLYEKMSNELRSALLHDCIATAIPFGPDDEKRIQELTATAEHFFNFLEQHKFLDNAAAGFKQFTDEFNVMFNNRHCTKIVVEARTLISAPYIELTTVGYDSVDERETMDEIQAECAQMKNRGMSQENFPRILRFAKCQISKSTIQLIDLLKSTVISAANSDSQTVAERLVQTARNIVQLFICIAPRHHHTQISSVPQIAAIFYNNCYYMCHCLMTLPVDIPEEARVALTEKHLAITFVDFLPALRQLAAESLEKHFAQCRRQIASLLSDDSVFVDLDDEHNLATCEETLNACTMYLTQLSNVWRGIFSNTVFAKALGNLVAFFFNSLIRIIFATEDIRAYDAEASAKRIQGAISSVEKLFIFGDMPHSSIHRFAEKEYFRIKEVVFCLNASLQDIFDRWCSGKGPLAQWLQSKELRQLVKALFQATEKREYVLKIIG